MDIINNVFVSGGSDVVSLSIYNNANSYKNGRFTHSAATLPNAKLRSQSSSIKPGNEAAFNQSIRRDKREELAEIETLKTRLARDDVPFRIETIRKAYEMPAENEFQRNGKKYPYPDAYLMKNPFPKKKKKKKGKKKGKK